MPAFPAYRVRLFLSADIVGSTAFKAGRGRKPGQDRTTPTWVVVTRDLYLGFARALASDFAALSGGIAVRDPGHVPPLPWKIIGDEIVFCCRLVDLQHLACCVGAFIRTVHGYTDRLKAVDPDLAVKANGWVAAFPSVNVLVPMVSAGTGAAEELVADEAVELQADERPHAFEFLGPDIDAGFRVGAHAREDRFSVSCALAVLLADACDRGHCRVDFAYRGRAPLKGVIGGRPYPVVTIDMERDAGKIAVRDHENALTGTAGIVPMHLANFLRAFMHDERMDLPQLLADETERDARPFPRHYEAYRSAYAAPGR